MRFPPNVPTHNNFQVGGEQTFFFNENGLLQRLDYVAVGPAAHYCFDHTLNGPVGMDLDMQIKLFETALDELDQNSDLINQVLEITLGDANDVEFTIIRYELPTLPFPFPEGAASRTPGSPVRAARAVTRCWGETFLGR